MRIRKAVYAAEHHTHCFLVKVQLMKVIFFDLLGKCK